jgi:hypothetical protein
MGTFETECVIRGRKHKLEFEIVETSQHRILSGSTCEGLGLMQFTVPNGLHIVEHVQHGPLSREQLLSRYDDVFNRPVESVPVEVHFEVDESITPVQCAPRNVPIAMNVAMKAQLDKYEADGHMISVTEPSDWISNMVVVKKAEGLHRPKASEPSTVDPKHLNQALKQSHYIMPTLENVLYKLSKARIFTLVNARDAFL